MASSYIPYKSRPHWGDIVPIPQKDAENGLVPIAYTEEYSDASSHFRAISAKNEHSERVLELTEHIIRLNPAHYTVWNYRFQTLKALGSPLDQELELMNEFARENLKSYQVWHHRLLLLTSLPPTHFLPEVAFIHASLLPDPKNYHTWAYLSWLFSHSSTLPAPTSPVTPDIWAAEQKWCDEMLDSSVVLGQKDAGEAEGDGGGVYRGDERNNSAWGWRWFLKVGRFGAAAAPEVAEGEISYAIQHILKIPNNASAWAYLRGIHTHFKIPMSQSIPKIEHLASDISTTVPINPGTTIPVPLALEFLGDACLQEGTFDLAIEAFDKLKGKDAMRKTYWQHMRQKAQKQARKLEKAAGGSGVSKDAEPMEVA